MNQTMKEPEITEKVDDLDVLERARKSHGSRHALIMALCCLIPILAIVVLWMMGFPSILLFFAILLLCPLMHFLMISMQTRRGQHPNHGNLENGR
ncbi:MAG: DUF2933 domain-containing protein [Thermoplasmata archaeon]